jgi:hypothetical protein
MPRRRHGAVSVAGPVVQSIIIGPGRKRAAIIGGERVEVGDSYGWREGRADHRCRGVVEGLGGRGHSCRQASAWKKRRPNARIKNEETEPVLAVLPYLPWLRSPGARSRRSAPARETLDRISSEIDQGARGA